MSKNVLEIIQIIEKCPTWFIGGKDNATKQTILRNLLEISKYPIRYIEKAIIEYIKQKESAKVYDYGFDEMAKIYILNRYLFNVPEYVPVKKHKVFSGFYGFPQNDRSVGELWPLSFDEKHRLIILDTFHGFNGSGYRAVEEFRYFKSLYGLRKHPK